MILINIVNNFYNFNEFWFYITLDSIYEWKPYKKIIFNLQKIYFFQFLYINLSE